MSERVSFGEGARAGTIVGIATLLMSAVVSSSVLAADAPANKKKYGDFSEVTEGAKQYDGLFKMYEVDDHLYAELRPNHFREMFLAPITIARGMASAGTPLNFGDEWILTFRRVGDRVQLIRKNVHYEAPKDTPVGRAVEQNYTDSVLRALPIVSINPSTQGVLIDFSAIFLTDFAELGLGAMDRSRSSWHKVKAFENNVELEVEATFASRFGGRSFGDDGVIDSRGITLVIHYSLAKRPGPGYKPRFADQRVGHFISATKDFSKSTGSNFVRRINRWRIEKANPQAKLSPPKKQLIWWVENTVPHEYRPYVEEGILEWNKAFEKIGYRSALGVRWQNENDEFDPEDINYCTFRWITTPSTFAMSGLRADPITGEMIDGDVIFDASWIRAWKDEYALMVGAPAPTGQDGQMAIGPVLDVAEIISPMMAAKFGYGVPMPAHQRNRIMQQHDMQQLDHAQRHHDAPILIPSERSPLNWLLNQRLTAGNFNACNCAASRRHEYTLAAMALAARSAQDGDDAESDDDDEEDENDDENSDDDDEKEKELELPAELIGQAIKEVVMHEVGHSLGLRHNFKASSMLTLEQINDPEITRVRGVAGSVMDYNPLNISRKGQKQGEFAMTTIGPYDYWAIEYAYTPVQGSEQAALQKIADRSPEPDLVYATDEDLYMSNDPLVNTYDLGDDNLAYAKDRIALADELIKNLDSTVVRDGESWYRLRRAFLTLLGQYGNGAYMSAAYIGGEYFSRDFKGTEKARDPITPVAGEKQRAALDFLISEILQDKAFEFSPQLLRRLTTEYWYHWGSNSLVGSGPEFDVHRYVLTIQQIVLSHCLRSDVLGRLQNQQLLADKDDKPLKVEEVFSKLNDGIWSELKATGSINVSLIRRNLQRDFVARLMGMVVSNSNRSSPFPYAVIVSSSGSLSHEARSLARMHLNDLHKRLESALANAVMDDATRAHFQETHAAIGRALDSVIVDG